MDKGNSQVRTACIQPHGNAEERKGIQFSIIWYLDTQKTSGRRPTFLIICINSFHLLCISYHVIQTAAANEYSCTWDRERRIDDGYEGYRWVTCGVLMHMDGWTWIFNEDFGWILEVRERVRRVDVWEGWMWTGLWWTSNEYGHGGNMSWDVKD